MDRHRKLPESRCAGISQCSVQESNLAGTLSGPPQNLRAPWQTYTFTCTFSQWHKITFCIYSYLDINAKHLKSAVLNRPWGFKSPSGHQKIKELNVNGWIDLGRHFCLVTVLMAVGFESESEPGIT
jgi:hypothetical protein